MITDKADQDEAVVAILAAVIRDANQMADLTAAFLDRIGFARDDDRCGWNPAFLLELAAVLRIGRWEIAQIKDVIDPTLLSFNGAFADVVERLKSQPERFLHGETPWLNRTFACWWFKCAHPKERFLQIDVALVGVEPHHLLTNVAQLLWNVRNSEY